MICGNCEPMLSVTEESVRLDTSRARNEDGIPEERVMSLPTVRLKSNYISQDPVGRSSPAFCFISLISFHKRPLYFQRHCPFQSDESAHSQRRWLSFLLFFLAESLSKASRERRLIFEPVFLDRRTFLNVHIFYTFCILRWELQIQNLVNCVLLEM